MLSTPRYCLLKYPNFLVIRSGASVERSPEATALPLTKAIETRSGARASRERLEVSVGRKFSAGIKYLYLNNIHR